MITHVVMMKFKPDVTGKSIDELEALLDELPDRINEIQSYDFGWDLVPPSVPTTSSWYRCSPTSTCCNIISSIQTIRR